MIQISSAAALALMAGVSVGSAQATPLDRATAPVLMAQTTTGAASTDTTSGSTATSNTDPSKGTTTPDANKDSKPPQQK